MMLLARSSAGLILWAAGFSLLYGLHGLGCANGWNEVGLAGATLFRWLLVVTWLLLCVGAAAVVCWPRDAPAGLERRLSVTSALAGFAAMLITGAPVAVTSACA